MRTYFAIRLVMTGVAAASLAAVLLGRSAPRTLSFQYDPVSYLSMIDARDFGAPPRVLDARTGRLSALPLPARQDLRWCSISPWVDGNGERHLVGWWTVLGEGGRLDAVPTGCRLARLSFPGGRLAESLPDAPVPIGRPCWSPGKPERLLYPAYDGRLYCIDFGEIDARVSDTPTIQLVSWNHSSEPLREPFVESICWPDDHAFGGRLLAAARFPEATGQMSRTRLCWLTLDPSGTEITKAETIAVGHPPGLNHLAFTCASLSLKPDGRWFVAFQCASGKGEPNTLWVATVDSDELLKAHVIPSTELRLVADCVARVPAAFSPYGSALYAVLSPGERGSMVRRYILEPHVPSSGGVN